MSNEKWNKYVLPAIEVGGVVLFILALYALVGWVETR
jgi:hypothetical protein